ncbi:MAG: DUF4230 domain-containing protein, partial [Bacteroidota bacterium]
ENNIMSTHANPNRNKPSKNNALEQQQQEKSNLETRIASLEGKTQEFYNYQLWSPQFLNRIILVAGTLAIGFCVWSSFAFFKKSPSVDPIYTKIEGIKRLGELHLVEHYYESIIPVTNQKKDNNGKVKGEKLEFLLKAPVKVSGYLDFSQIQVSMQEDSLLRINLPPAEISKAYWDVKKTEEYLVDGKLRIFNRYLEQINYKEAYKDIASGINKNKSDIRDRAKRNAIEKETQMKAEVFLRNFVSALGYRVEFANNSDFSEQTDSTKNALLD